VDRSRAIADGPSILRYIHNTAQAFDVERLIRLNHRVASANWDSEEKRWTVEVYRTDSGEMVTISCSFLYVCTGYYRYDEGFSAEFLGVEDFRGPLIHPQHWPEDLDYAGKRVVVIGSGATAVTLVPTLAESAAHVTMLQRSPTSVASRLAVTRSPIGCGRGCHRSSPMRSCGGRTHYRQSRSSTSAAAARDDEVDVTQGRGQAAGRGRRCRHPFRAVVQPVGSADVSGARRPPA
jgi:hypothetical protein